MDDFDMTCSDFVNALKMLISSEKHPVSRANYGYTKRVVMDRWEIIETYQQNKFLQIWICSTIFCAQ